MQTRRTVLGQPTRSIVGQYRRAIPPQRERYRRPRRGGCATATPSLHALTWHFLAHSGSFEPGGPRHHEITRYRAESLARASKRLIQREPLIAAGHQPHVVPPLDVGLDFVYRLRVQANPDHDKPADDGIALRYQSPPTHSDGQQKPAQAPILLVIPFRLIPYFTSNRPAWPSTTGITVLTARGTSQVTSSCDLSGSNPHGRS